MKKWAWQNTIEKQKHFGYGTLSLPQNYSKNTKYTTIISHFMT